MYMEELNDELRRQSGKSDEAASPARVEPDGDITDMVRAEKITVNPA